MDELAKIAAANGSTLGLVTLGVSISLKSLFDWLGKRTRVPLKRAHDEHVERMTALLADVADKQRMLSIQQERTAEAVGRLDEKLNDVRGSVRVLVDRGVRQ